jgi:hypothetical protein
MIRTQAKNGPLGGVARSLSVLSRSAVTDAKPYRHRVLGKTDATLGEDSTNMDASPLEYACPLECS